MKKKKKNTEVSLNKIGMIFRIYYSIKIELYYVEKISQKLNYFIVYDKLYIILYELMNV